MEKTLYFLKLKIGWLKAKNIAFILTLFLFSLLETNAQNCPVVTTNFHEDFDSTPTGSTTNASEPDCWAYLDDVVTTGYGYTTSGAANANSPNNFFRFYRTNSAANSSQDVLLVSPETNNLGNGTKQVRFYARTMSATYLNNTFEVVSMSDNTSSATITTLATFNVTGIDYQEFIVPLPAANDDYFGFRLPHNGGTTVSYVYLDDVYYEDLEDCFFPTDITITNITQNSADISWTASVSTGVTGYEYEVRSSGLPGSGTTGLETTGTVTGTSATVTGLNPSTTYTVYVRSVCGTDDGRWTPTGEGFATLCGIVTNNFYENFDSTPAGSTSNATYPNCWSYIDDVTSTGYGYVLNGATYAQSGSQSFRLYRTNSATNASEELVLISPETADLGNGTKQLRFSVRSYSTTYLNQLEILALPDNTSTANATILATVYHDGTTYQEYIVPLAATTDDYFAFRLAYNGVTTASSVVIDDVYYEDLSPCIFPMNIQANNITITGTTISWDASLASGVTGYEYEIRTSGAPGSGTVGLEASGTTTTTSANVTGLTGATTYYVYVRSVCGSTNGDWTTFPLEFTTLCPIMGDFYEDFDTVLSGTTSNPTYPNCWSYINDITSTGYGYVLNSATYAQSGSQSFRLYRTNSTTNASEELVLISPETVDLGNGTKQLRFSLRSYGTTQQNQLEILVLPDNTSTANATVIATVNYDETTYQEYIVPLPITTDDYFGFRMAYNGVTTASSVVIDDVYYEDLADCIFPMGLDATNITTNNATISWDPSLASSVTGYEYEVRTSGEAGSGTTGLETSGTTTNTTINLTGLDPSTHYVVYVRSVCGSSNGDWTTFPVDFYTLCGIVTGNFYEGFDNTPTGGSTNPTFPYCWSHIDDVVTTGYGYVSGTAQSAPNAYYMYKTNTAANVGEDLILISPETDNLGNGNGFKQVRFSARSGSTSYNNMLEILTADSNLPGATYTVLDTINVDQTVYQEFVVYFPQTTDDYFAFRLVHNGTTTASGLYIDDVYYEDAPTCKPIDIKNIQINNVDKNSFDVSWLDLYNTTVAYEVEVRETGTPGTAGAAFTTTTGIGVTSATVTGLDPSTKYTVYVRAKCSPTDSSDWNEGIDASTLCDYPDLVSYTQSLELCGPQKAHLSAVVSDSTASVFWYDAPTDMEPLFEGEDFVSEDDVTHDRSFWLRTGAITPNTPIQAGAGNEMDASSWNFLYCLYHAYKHQYIFTADELMEFGLTAGPITALQFDIIAVGNYNPRLDFSIALGATTNTVATTTMVDNNTLTQVYSNSAQPLNTGIMTFTFTTPYVWDGMSNIVMQVVSNNGAWGSPYGAVRGHIALENRTSLHYADNIATSALLATTTPTGVNSATSNKRPNTVFVGTAGCMSPIIEIPVTVSPKPDFELSSYKVTSCEGGVSELVTITTNLGGYDTFVWTPSTGVSGDAVNGWTFTAPVEQEYTLSASQSSGICEHIKTVLVFSGVEPEANPNLTSVHDICVSDITELNILEELPDDVTIGNNTTTTSATSEVSAFVQSEVYSKQQYIYSASELIALGVNGAGFITSLDFNTINSGASFDNANYTIKMKAYNNTSFPDDNFVTGDFTTVYTIGVHTHTFQGWQQFAFDNPFYWDGQSNIIVQITMEGMGDGANNAQTYYTDVTGTNVGLYATDETDPDPATGTRTTNRLDARFSFEQSNVTWSPATNLFVDAAATIPYTSGQNALTVYHTSSQTSSQVYTATLAAPSGCVTTKDYTINSIAVGTPVVASQTFCEPISVSNIVVTGHQGAPLNFYNSATSNTPITTISQSGTYYVQAGQGDCISTRVSFSVSIVTLANPTVTQFTQVVCGTGTIADLTATATSGAQIQWYSSATSTTPLPSTQALVNNTTYYAAQTMSGCVSGRVAVLVNVNPAPAALTSQTINICGNLTYDGASLNQVAGAELVWYQSATSTQPIPGTGQIVSGTYYVSQKVNGCESPRAQIIVSAQSGTVSAPTATTQNICGAGTVADLVAQTATGGVAVWYNSSTSTTPLQSTDVLSSGTYYVAQQVGNCLSTKIAVSVRIINTTIPAVAPFNLCEGATVADLTLPTPTGATHKWYLNSTSTVPLDPTDVLSSGYYFVVRTQSGCETDRVQVQVTINSRPSSPTGATLQGFENYGEIGSLEMDQTNVVWYLTYEDAMNNVNPLPANMPLVHETTYYAVIIGSNGCPSLPTAVEVRITLEVNDFDLTQLKYYPNPTSDLLTISYNEPIVKVEVFDLNGRMIMNRDFDKETVELDFSKLSSGTYMLNIKTKDSSQFVKIIKK